MAVEETLANIKREYEYEFVEKNETIMKEKLTMKLPRKHLST